MLRQFFTKAYSFSFNNKLRAKISETDPEIFNQIMNEKQRQVNGVNLIAS
jgi:hypothetical protein